jgi:Domain of unknown function (DUF4126)
MDALIALGRTLGFSFAAGINLYATVAIVGLASRYGWVALPEQYRVFDNDLVIGAAIVLYIIEFFADKVPWIDSAWDAVHTVVRPIGGALLAVGTLGEASPAVEGLVALVGGSLAAGTHFTKAGTRVAANASPEPFSNWILSITEDIFVVTLGFITLKYPLVAAAIVIVGVVLMIVFATWIIRMVRRRWSGSATTPTPNLQLPTPKTRGSNDLGESRGH